MAAETDTANAWITWEIEVPTTHASKNPHRTSDSPKTWLQLSPSICGGTEIPKSMDAQVPCVKWHRTMQGISPPHLQIPSPVIRRDDCIFIFKNVPISGPYSSNLCCSGANCILKIISKCNDQDPTRFTDSKYDYLQVKSLLTDIWLPVLPISNHSSSECYQFIF